jgi:hypothetical protein
VVTQLRPAAGILMGCKSDGLQVTSFPLRPECVNHQQGDFVPIKIRRFFAMHGKSRALTSHGPADLYRIRLARFGRRRRAKTALSLDETDNALQAFALLKIGHDEGPFPPHAPGIGVHFF